MDLSRRGGFRTFDDVHRKTLQFRHIDAFRLFIGIGQGGWTRDDEPSWNGSPISSFPCPIFHARVAARTSKGSQCHPDRCDAEVGMGRPHERLPTLVEARSHLGQKRWLGEGVSRMRERKFRTRSGACVQHVGFTSRVRESCKALIFLLSVLVCSSLFIKTVYCFCPLDVELRSWNMPTRRLSMTI